MRKRRIAALLSAGALAAGLSIGLAAAAYASGPAVPAATWNEIFVPFDNGHGNTMCVDVPGGTSAPGAQLQLYHCHGYASDGAPQRWHFSCTSRGSCAVPNSAYQVSNASNNLCIGFPDGDRFGTAGERLVQESCSSTLGWVPVPQNRNDTDPLLELEAVGSDSLCMAAANTFDNNQTPLVATTCDGFTDAAQILELG